MKIVLAIALLLVSSAVCQAQEEAVVVGLIGDSNYQGSLTAYANAAEGVAGELSLPFIDLHRASIAHHNKIGRDESMSYNFKEGDKTHFNKKGAESITDLILKELKSVVPELAAFLKVAASAKQ